MINASLIVAALHKTHDKKNIKISFTNSEGWNVTPKAVKEIYEPLVIEPHRSTIPRKTAPKTA